MLELDDDFPAWQADVPRTDDFFYIMGWCKSDVLPLQWRQIDFMNGIVLLNPGTTKNDERRVFPS
jgi:hypothetical protein